MISNEVDEKSSIFKIGDKIHIKHKEKNSYITDGVITGKLSGTNNYVIATRSTRDMRVYLIPMFGFPIRNVKLEYGKFSGKENEFVINARFIVVQKEI